MNNYSTTINDLKILDIPKIKDTRGNLSVIEKDLLPFSLKRVYYLYDIPSGAYRGGHAHITQQELLIAISGSFNLKLQDKKGNKKTITLNKPNKGLYVPNLIWRELEDFSSGAICLVLSSSEFSENDYIREYQSFIDYIK